MTDEIYPLGGSGCWAWRHYGLCYTPYFEVYGSAEQAAGRSARHAKVCGRSYDEWGYYSMPPDWRAYLGYRTWS